MVTPKPQTMTYRRTMTRDNGLIVQELWSYAFEEGFGKTAGTVNPHAPSLVYHVVDGATEIWEQDAAFEWFKDKLLELNRHDPGFITDRLAEYQHCIADLEQYRTAAPSDLPTLKILIEDLLREASRQFVVLYYTALDKRMPRQARGVAVSWRDTDELYDFYERIIKRAISHLYPVARGMELVVTIDDLDRFPPAAVLSERFSESVFVPGSPPESLSLAAFSNAHPDFQFVIDQPIEEATVGRLTGQTAVPGNVRGRVRILRRKSEVDSLQSGEILVSPMTTPDFVPAMKRAGAIVTDEGGITCHAAIVSRELGKPCVTGTRHASTVLRTGDLVEVNADAGTVRRLDRSLKQTDHSNDGTK